MSLVALDLAVCPVCSGPLREACADEPALLRHGGYGATRRSCRTICEACGWTLLASISERRPEPR